MRAAHTAALAAMVASCNRCEPAEAPKDAAPSATVSASPVVEDAAPAIDASIVTSVVDAGPFDAGASACRLSYGPAEQTFRGPAALVATATELRLVANDSGKPKIYSVPLGAPTPPKPTSFVGMRWPPCELAGKWVYCQGPAGVINRSAIDGEGLVQVATSRPGTRIAAGAVGTQHSVVAYLDSKRTTEGEVLQAFAVLDHGEIERLSEDGAGATTVRIVPRGEGALAAYLDTRTSMVPVHARSIGANGEKLALGADAVVFVGGAPERGVDFTIATPKKGDPFVLLPIAHESLDFGMAAIQVHDPPKTDVAAVWSMYPNGLDPAPIAAAGSLVARVRPREREPGSPRILELGRIDEGGAFTSLGAIADGRRITDIAMTTDKDGVWILYGDTNATFLERRVCP